MKSGYNDFVSCAEMEFWQTNSTNTLNDEVLTVFTDLSCSELRKDVTGEKINALSDYFTSGKRSCVTIPIPHWRKISE